jgi:hypothetical protein
LLPLLLHRTGGGSPLDTLVRLFFLQQPVETPAAQQALAPMQLEEWADLGLLKVEGPAVVPEMRLDPVDPAIYASDRIEDRGVVPDSVLGPSPASRTMGLLTVRRHSRRTLDVGTGCGCLALMAAGHSDQVVGVDCNPRALRYAALNALLNRRTNLQFLQGDFLQPVCDQSFDLIVGNPPFVVSPEKRFTFRDSGLPGDEMLQTLIRDVPPLLYEGGYCQFLANWIHVAGQDWRQRLAGWFAGNGCDVWVQHVKTEDAASYASEWLRQTEAADLRRSADRFAAWLAYYKQERIEAVSYGLITMRRATAHANWFRCDSIPEASSPCGDAIVRAFALHDFLDRTRTDRDLMNARLCRPPELHWEQELKSSPEGWSVIASRLRLTTGLRYQGNADPLLAAVVTGCDGQTALGAVLGELAASLGRDLDAVVPASLQAVRQLVSLGLLVPAEGTDASRGASGKP